MSEKVAKTICEQGHLLPIINSTTPIYWNLDHSLRLYPLPTVIILGENQAFYHHHQEACCVMSPGSMTMGHYGKYTLHYRKEDVREATPEEVQLLEQDKD